MTSVAQVKRDIFRSQILITSLIDSAFNLVQNYRFPSQTPTAKDDLNLITKMITDHQTAFEEAKSTRNGAIATYIKTNDGTSEAERTAIIDSHMDKFPVEGKEEEFGEMIMHL